MKRLLSGLALAALLACSVLPARAALVAGYLAQCTAVATGSCTEQTQTGYARQPTLFSNLTGSGGSVNSMPYTYATGISGSIQGHAVYDAPTGGNVLLVIPYASALSLPSQGDRGDVGAITFSITGASGSTADSYNTTWQAATVIGTTPDGSSVSTGIANKIEHGQGYPFYGTADVTTRTTTQTTGFTYTVPTGVSALDIKGAGTLAAGTITLPQPLTDGFLFRLSCTVTVTALTMTAAGGPTIVGTAPTTCGPGSSHQLQYFSVDTSWHVHF